MFDVVSIGEVLIDFSPTAKEKMGRSSFGNESGGASQLTAKHQNLAPPPLSA